MQSIDRSKLFLQASLNQHAFRAIRRLSHIRPTHRRWQRERAGIDLARQADQNEALSILGDLVVRSGPFVGMRLQRESSWGSDVVTMMLGIYERELHKHIEDAIASEPKNIYDVGSADGYYAVGLALRVPGATIHAFDIDDHAQQMTGKLAALNGVLGRLRISGGCSTADLMELPEHSLVIMDCEGAELYLLTDGVVNSNPTTTFVVECHDVFDARISSTLRSRFRDRNLLVVAGQPRFPGDAPMLPSSLASRVLDEHRGQLGCWIIVE